MTNVPSGNDPLASWMHVIGNVIEPDKDTSGFSWSWLTTAAAKHLTEVEILERNNYKVASSVHNGICFETKPLFCLSLFFHLRNAPRCSSPACLETQKQIKGH